MAPDNVRGGPRLPVLDGIRGLAIVMICFYHFYAGSIAVVRKSNLAIDRAFFHAVDACWTSVDMFFVLSGFLITGILLDAKSGEGYFRNFYARRFLRIFPLYYGFLLFLIVILPLFLRNDPDLQLLQENQAWYWTYTLNFLVPLHPRVDLGFYGSGQLWSLAVEEQFYLLWPLVVILVSRRALIGICCACIVGAFLLRLGLINGAVDRLDNVFAPAMLLPARMDSLTFGALLAALFAERKSLAFLRPLALPAAGVAILGFVVLFVIRDGLYFFDPWVQIGGYSLAGLLWASMLLGALTFRPSHPLPRALSIGPLRFYGKYSYAMYIFHLQIVLLMMRHFGNRAEWPLVLGSAIPSRLAFTFLGIAIVTVMAWGSWYLFESQFLKLKRYFEYRRPVHVLGGGGSAETPAPAVSAPAPTPVSSARGGT